MTPSKSLEHCSDGALLAFADGELSALARRSVARHLDKCWDCRARLNDFERQAQDLARALRQESLLPPHRIAEAKVKLAHKQREWAAQPRAGALDLLRLARCAVYVGAAAVAIVCIAVLARWRPPAKLEATPVWRDVLTRAEKQEKALAETRLVARQTLSVRVRTVEPASVPRQSRVEIWADRQGGRYASRWYASGGLVRQAAWNGPGDAPPAEFRSLADLGRYGLSPEQVEAAFWRLLESRRWRPVSLSADFSVFASSPDVRLEASRDGSRLRLKAICSRGGLDIEMSVELDSGTLRPILQAVRFASGGRAVEFQVEAVHIEQVAFSNVPESIFRAAPAGLPSGGAVQGAPPLPRQQPQAQPTPAAAALADSKPPLAAILDALHRAGACLGEPVELAEDPHGRVTVHALAKSPQRKAELSGALEPFREQVAIDIQTPSEAARELPHPPAPAGADGEYRTGRLLIEEQLRQYVRHWPGESLPERVNRFANNAVSAGDAALAEAWAIHRHAAQAALVSRRDPGPFSHRLLEGMVREHLAALHWRVSRARTLLLPFLSPLAGGSGPAPAEESPARDEDPASATVRELQFMNGLIRSLFAGDSGSAAGSAVSPAAGSVERQIWELVQALDRLESGSGNLEAGILRQLSQAAAEAGLH